MELIVRPTVEGVAAYAADLVTGLLQDQPETHLCLAAGGTPRPLYAELVRRRADLSRAFTTKLDEWLGLPLDHLATCETDLRQHLLTPLQVSESRYLAFDSQPADPETECERVQERLREWGPFDLSILGLGLNGHLGMNEPAEALQPRAHVVTLAEESRQHAMLQDLPNPPTLGLTMGMADLLQSRQVLLLVTGESKREALRRVVEGEITTRFPASLLQCHPACVCVADEASAP